MLPDLDALLVVSSSRTCRQYDQRHDPGTGQQWAVQFARLVVQIPAGERTDWTAIGEWAAEAERRLRGNKLWDEMRNEDRKREIYEYSPTQRRPSRGRKSGCTEEKNGV
ncbi:MAG: hypothetical protein A2Z16_00725 [Chloroflexi bacterium RBG_16_54_18]|nr:MAG: hypothetical protein A2Z16_00725 [Chloroflexi bacterium RBG_16_54_18]